MISYQQALKKLRANPKTWLITGAAGFIGANFLDNSAEKR